MSKNIFNSYAIRGVEGATGVTGSNGATGATGATGAPYPVVTPSTINGIPSFLDTIGTLKNNSSLTFDGLSLDVIGTAQVTIGTGVLTDYITELTGDNGTYVHDSRFFHAGIEMTQSVSNPVTASTNTLWLRSADNHLMRGAVDVEDTGDVVGPVSSTDNAVSLYNGTTGKLLKNSTLTYATTGTVTELYNNGQLLNLQNSTYTTSFALAGAGSAANAGNHNLLIGANGGSNLTSGSRTTTVGVYAGQNNSTGVDNTCIGFNSSVGNFYGVQNTTVGSYAAQSATGSRNLCVGYRSGKSLVAENDCIYIMNEGVTPISAEIRIGTTGTHTKTTIAGIYGVAPSTPQMAIINAAGQLGSNTLQQLNNGYSITNVTTSPYTVLTTDEVIICSSTTLAITLNLPAATNKMKVKIIDNGNAAVNNITINRAGADTINGTTSLILNSNYSTVNLISDSVSKWYIC